MNQTPRVSWPLRHRGRLACTRSLERRTAGCVLFVTCYLLLCVCVSVQRDQNTHGDMVHALAIHSKNYSFYALFSQAGTHRVETQPKLHVCPGHYGTVVGSRARGRSRDARPGVS